MKIYAVVDTNVIVSAMLNPESIPGTVLHYCFSGRIIPVLNKEIFEEYANVIKREKFNFTQDDINSVLRLFKEKGIVVDRTKAEEEFIDKKDIVFYEITLTGRVETETYLVTGNLKHFPKKPFIVSPREMLMIIDDEEDNDWSEYIAENNQLNYEKFETIIAFIVGNSVISKKNVDIARLFAYGLIDYETAIFAIRSNSK